MTTLKRLRIANNLTIEQVAEDTELNVGTISKIERKDHSPNHRTLYRLFTYFQKYEPNITFEALEDEYIG